MTDAEADRFIARAKQVFPGAYEPNRGERATMSEHDSDHYASQAAALSTAITERLGEAFLEGDGEARLGLIDSPLFGQVVAFHIDQVIYALEPPADDLVAIRAGGGGTEWATIDADGNYGPWKRQAPPQEQATWN